VRQVSAVPDLLAPDLRAVLVGINPGLVSAAAGQHFANPRNDFWRLLHASGLTPRLIDPSESAAILQYRLGITNAALRTTPGSGDLRRADFADALHRLERIERELSPGGFAFVGKEAYRGVFGRRAEHGVQAEMLGSAWLFVLPSTSPANAAVPYDERLHWFTALAALAAPLH
jgi:TDG/mug DNA glycosylase family protein